VFRNLPVAAVTKIWIEGIFLCRVFYCNVEIKTRRKNLKLTTVQREKKEFIQLTDFLGTTWGLLREKRWSRSLTNVVPVLLAIYASCAEK
jgi:hypothetical protein